MALTLNNQWRFKPNQKSLNCPVVVYCLDVCFVFHPQIDYVTIVLVIAFFLSYFRYVSLFEYYNLAHTSGCKKKNYRELFEPIIFFLLIYINFDISFNYNKHIKITWEFSSGNCSAVGNHFSYVSCWFWIIKSRNSFFEDFVFFPKFICRGNRAHD